MDGGESLGHFFEESEFGETHLAGAASPEDIFSILESLEETGSGSKEGGNQETVTTRLVSQKSTSSSALQEYSETDLGLEGSSPKRKRQKAMMTPTVAASSSEEGNPDQPDGEGQQRMSHITVERNRRKQMNDQLSVLRSLMPCFYVKRGDQASIIGGVVEYINELQQLLQSLEAKKQRKVYSEVVSPRISVSSPRVPSSLSPRIKPPLSPRVLSLPISPRTPQPNSPFNMPRLNNIPPTIPSPSSSSSSATNSSSIIDNANELVANSKSAIADVEVKFTGPNVLLKTVSPWIPGQAVKIISALEELSLEILHVSIGSLDETMLNSFTIKVGIECRLSAKELAQQIQQTFCQVH